MILGVGNDIVDIRRIERTLERFGERFIQRIFTPVEQARSEGRRERVASYAKRFAAKEACAKALGTGFRKGIYWQDMGVINLASGKPTMLLTGGARRRLAEITPPGKVAQIDLTITDDWPLAQAVVLISAWDGKDETCSNGTMR
jgi:holo-[acyl-carrier protein] synthase